MVNDIVELVIIVVIIKNVDNNLRIKREICAIETQISHPLQLRVLTLHRHVPNTMGRTMWFFLTQSTLQHHKYT